MSKTVRISDELYRVLDDYRRKDQTFQAVIEELARRAGLFPTTIKDVDALTRKLEEVYGYDSAAVTRVIRALQRIYIGQENERSIGVPHEDIEPEYGNEVDALERLGLIEARHYTGKYEYGYRTTAVGARVGSEQVRRTLDEHDADLRELFNGYSAPVLAVLVRFGFEQTDTGHLSTRGAELKWPRDDSLISDETIQHHYETFIEQLSEMGLAVTHSEGSFTVLPPEFNEYLQTTSARQTDTLGEIELYRLIKRYATGDLTTRGELLEQLHAANEDDLEAVVTSLHDEGLTSKYSRNNDAPFLLTDYDQLLVALRERVTRVLGDR
ncbi:hypothetical protein ACFQH3_12130 [Haladaptatus sp. GCM10025707]|uniref:hypothetical protein n=1 Tax=unclassified Haladaptatus TaxID=2622732 RepID=UPI0023E7CF80|nr:hypothetical protein [Haladaptatus sp. QDMS2]